MQDLRQVLLLIGGAAIFALVIHGLWVSHRQRRMGLNEEQLVYNAQLEQQSTQAIEEQETSQASDADVKEPKAPELLDEIYVINIMSKQGNALHGSSLRKILKKYGFHFGKLSLFHRFEKDSGEGNHLFSLINMVYPGSFELDELEKLRTIGVSLFMQPPKNGDALARWELMLSYANKIAQDLDSLVVDEQREPLTETSIEEYRERLREIDRTYLLVS